MLLVGAATMSQKKTSPGEGMLGIAEAWWDDFHKQTL